MTQLPHGFHHAVELFKRQLLIQTLAATQGNRSAAARALKLQRTYFVRLLGQFAPDVPPARKGALRSGTPFA